MVDLSGIENFIPPIAQMLGIEPSTALLLVGILIVASNVASKLIPDDATGWLGVIRKIAAVIGLCVGNRIVPGVSVNDVAKAVVGTSEIAMVEHLAEQAGALIPEVIESVESPAVPPFPAHPKAAPARSRKKKDT